AVGAASGSYYRHGRLLQPRRMSAVRRLDAPEERRRGLSLPRVRLRAGHRPQRHLPEAVRGSERLRGADRARTGDDPPHAAQAGVTMPHDHDHKHHKDHKHGATDVPQKHKSHAPASAKVYVITCSDSRTVETDEGGALIKKRLKEEGHVLAGSAIIPDEPSRIHQELQRAQDAAAQVVLITGGTGIT